MKPRVASTILLLAVSSWCSTAYGADQQMKMPAKGHSKSRDSMNKMDMDSMDMSGMDMSGSHKSNMDGMNMSGPQKNMGGMDMKMTRPNLSEDSKHTTQENDSLDQDIPATLRPAIEKNEFSTTTANGVSYTLEQLQRLALNNNPTLLQARAQVAGEKGKALQAGLIPNPDIAYAGELLGLRTAGGGEFQGGVISQEVILGGKLKYSRKKYQARASAAEEQERAQRFRVSNDVAIGYYHTLAAAERLRIQKEFMKSARDSWLTTREMYNLGQANQADLHRVNISLEKQNLRVKTAVNELNLVWQQLMAVVGIDADYAPLQGTLETDVPNMEWQAGLTRVLAQSPELGEAKAKLKSDEITVQRERRQRVPNLLLSAGPGYDQLDRSFAAVAAANVTNIPLFNRNQGTIKQAQADLDRQRAQIRLIELQLKTRFAMQYKQFITARQHVEAYKTVIVPEAKQRYEVCLESYADTRLDWPVVLEAQRDFLTARISYIDHLLELQESNVELQGFLLSGGLVPPPGVTPPGHIDATPQPR